MPIVTYAYPNGTLFGVERDWLIEAGIMLEEDSPQSGRQWQRNNDNHYMYESPPSIGFGQELITVSIGRFAQPRRLESYRLLDKERLISVLNAFRGRVPLRPITADRGGYMLSMDRQTHRALDLRDGFHRFHASIIYGYPLLPVLTDKPLEPPVASSSSSEKKYIPPHLRNQRK